MNLIFKSRFALCWVIIQLHLPETSSGGPDLVMSTVTTTDVCNGTDARLEDEEHD